LSVELSPTVLSARIAARDALTILDVRSRWEFVRGHVPGAIHIPFWRMKGRAAEIPCTREDPVVVYCGHGPRAWYAAAVLRRVGFARVSYLEGHMSRWRREGRPEER
jgi:rhodanese-related sulfurtransferase